MAKKGNVKYFRDRTNPLAKVYSGEVLYTSSDYSGGSDLPSDYYIIRIPLDNIGYHDMKVYGGNILSDDEGVIEKVKADEIDKLEKTVKKSQDRLRELRK